MNNTVDPVIWPESFNLKLLLEDFISSLDNSNPPISPPVNKTLDPVIWPTAFNRNDSLADLISSVLTTNPAIEADLNVANPSAVIDALGVVAADGVDILSAVILPCTVKVPLSNCKKFPAVLLPNNIADPVTTPPALTLNADEEINDTGSDVFVDDEIVYVAVDNEWALAVNPDIVDVWPARPSNTRE